MALNENSSIKRTPCLSDLPPPPQFYLALKSPDNSYQDLLGEIYFIYDQQINSLEMKKIQDHILPYPCWKFPKRTLVSTFGQVCSWMTFTHKLYLVNASHIYEIKTT